jgi:hypothetical protein
VNVELHEVISTVAPGKVRLLQVAQDLATGACWVVRNDDLWTEALVVLGKFARAHQAAALAMTESDPPVDTFPTVVAAVEAWHRDHPVPPPSRFAGRSVDED